MLIHKWRLCSHRFLCVIFAFMGFIGQSAWCAPDDWPAWPPQRELLLAMSKGLKEPTNSNERIWIRGMHEIGVGKNEVAFLVSVWFPDRGRNFSSGTFLYRPKLKQAKELDYSQSLGGIYVTGHYGEFGLLEQYESGQGSEDFNHALVRFDGWRLQVLHEASFGTNLGACGDTAPTPRACEQTWVKFQLLPNQSLQGIDLLEITTRKTGADGAAGQVYVSSRRMRLVGDHFVVVGN